MTYLLGLSQCLVRWLNIFRKPLLICEQNPRRKLCKRTLNSKYKILPTAPPPRQHFVRQQNYDLFE